MWNDSEEARAVLIVDLWHPEIDAQARQKVRADLGVLHGVG